MKNIKKLIKLASALDSIGQKTIAKNIIKLSQQDLLTDPNVLGADSNEEQSSEVLFFPGKVINLDPGKVLFMRSSPTPLSSVVKKLEMKNREKWPQDGQEELLRHGLSTWLIRWEY